MTKKSCNTNICCNNVSKGKIVHVKSINKDKENTQGNYVIKKIPTMKKKPLQQIIKSNNIVIKNGIKYKNLNLNLVNNIGNLSYNANKIMNINSYSNN